MDREIYVLAYGKMVRTETVVDRPDRRNFLIVCDHGDWSGFRTLCECEQQIADLEGRGRRDFFFRIVERF